MCAGRGFRTFGLKDQDNFCMLCGEGEDYRMEYNVLQGL